MGTFVTVQSAKDGNGNAEVMLFGESFAITTITLEEATEIIAALDSNPKFHLCENYREDLVWVVTFEFGSRPIFSDSGGSGT